MPKSCSSKSLVSIPLSDMCRKDLYAYIRAYGDLSHYVKLVPTKPYVKKNALKQIAGTISVRKRKRTYKNSQTSPVKIKKKSRVTQTSPVKKMMNNPLFNNISPQSFKASSNPLFNSNKKQTSQNDNKEYKAFMNALIKTVLNKQINMNEVGPIREELRTKENKARFNQALKKAFTKNLSPSKNVSPRRSQRARKPTRRLITDI